MEYTTEKLLAMKPTELGQLYLNCLRLGGLRAEQLAKKIESLDVDIFFEGGLSDDNPILQKIREIVYSAEAIPLLLQAVNAGLPALAGIEPTIIAELGPKYSKFNTGTATAGAFVAIKMRQLGYKSSSDGLMPVGSVAKRALLWEPNS